MKIVHPAPENPTETRILIEGLHQPITLMHITDSHLVLADERDPDAVKLLPDRASKRPDAPALFAENLNRSNELAADATILTGDIISFPAWAGIDAIHAGVQTLEAPYLYTLGNHDWYFPYLEFNDWTRADHYPRFHGLTEGNPAYQVKEIGGVRLITLDNSNYQVTPAQLAFLTEQLATGQPCLLFIHIPIAIPALIPPVVERFKSPIIMAATEGWTEETRAALPHVLANETTLACHTLLTSGATENLVGIFCGHVHFSHQAAYREGRFQYVTVPSFEAGHRVIRLEPYQ